MIEVAIVSMEQALEADGEALPAGSGTLARDPLVLPAPASRRAAASPAVEPTAGAAERSIRPTRS